MAELDGAGNVTARFVYATGINVPDYLVKGDSTYRLIRDDRGSVRMLVNIQSGGVVQRIDYDEFGAEALNTNPGFQPFGFAGGLTETSTGLVRFGARDYDPVVGRWTAKDPIGFDGGSANLYVYVGNNPINTIDPLGLYDLWDLGEDALHFAAGLGDALSFGASTWIAQQTMGDGDAATLARVKQCSGVFEAGQWASLAVGLGRLAYAGLAKGGSLVYAAVGSAGGAVLFRNTLKQVFRLGLGGGLRLYTPTQMMAKYGSAAEVIAASGRTNAGINAAGALAAAGGAASLTSTDPCGCE